MLQFLLPMLRLLTRPPVVAVVPGSQFCATTADRFFGVIYLPHIFLPNGQMSQSSTKFPRETCGFRATFVGMGTPSIAEDFGEGKAFAPPFEYHMNLLHPFRGYLLLPRNLRRPAIRTNETTRVDTETTHAL